jgi:dynactin-4
MSQARCARSCFACPQCTAALQVIATDTIDPSSSASIAGPPYLLSCTGCKWSSRQVGWEFEKGTSIASKPLQPSLLIKVQLQKMLKEPQAVQDEFESIKDHIDNYITTSTPLPTVKSTVSRQPTRHISQLTQMAAKALGKDVPGMRSQKPRMQGERTLHESWDELGEFKSKGNWKAQGLERGMNDVEDMRNLDRLQLVRLENRWASSWDKDIKSR